jgi:hypothetical protein
LEIGLVISRRSSRFAPALLAFALACGAVPLPRAAAQCAM